MLGTALREWQQDALNRWKRNGNRGIAAVVTGGGKTIFALACIADVRSRVPDARFVIVVPTIALADQWLVSLVADLGVKPLDIAIYGGGSRPTQPKLISIAVINSARVIAPRLAEHYPTMLVVDECHRAASEKNALALSGPHVATLGLSATPDRDWDDLFDQVVVPALGPVIYEYGYNEARKDGVISSFEIVNVAVRLRQSEQRDYDRLTRRIAVAGRGAKLPGSADERVERLLQRRARVSALAHARLPMAVRLVERHRGERAIVFHEDIHSANVLHKTLLRRGHRSALYHSGLGPPIRQDNLRMFRTGQVDVLVTCRALDEGIDVPNARIAVIAASTASTRQRIQRLGRVLRPAAGKGSAVVYTIYATRPERDRLMAEAEGLEGAESVRWLQEAS